MDTLKQLKQEFALEYATTKKFFENFPEGINDYTPHTKSMKLMPLAQHIAEVFGWTPVILSTEVLDFGKGDPSVPFQNKQQLLDRIENDYQATISALDAATEADLEPNWSLAYKDQIIVTWTKYQAIRHTLNQVTHHRAQLGVYYRLNDIKVPGSYGPSADDQSF